MSAKNCTNCKHYESSLLHSNDRLLQDGWYAVSTSKDSKFITLYKCNKGLNEACRYFWIENGHKKAGESEDMACFELNKIDTSLDRALDLLDSMSNSLSRTLTTCEEIEEIYTAKVEE